MRSVAPRTDRDTGFRLRRNRRQQIESTVALTSKLCIRGETSQRRHAKKKMEQKKVQTIWEETGSPLS